MIRRVLVLSASVALVLSGCGGSSKKVDPAADLGVAKGAVLTATDVPTGYTGTPHTDSSDLPAAAKKAFADCMNVDVTLFDDTPGAQKADSPDFKKGDNEIDSTVELDPKKKDVDTGYDQMAKSQAPACLGQLFDSTIKSSAGTAPGVTFGKVTVTRDAVTGIGDRGFRFSGSLPVSAASQSLNFYFDVVLVQRARAGITLTTFQTNTPFDRDTELRLVRAMVDRVGDNAKQSLRVRFAVNSPPHAEPGALVELAVAAERTGWDAFFLWDHMVVDRAGVEIVDPWVTLGAIAARTERIRLGTCVTPLARRRPQKVARETVTLDRLSAGRLVLGVGLGTPDEDLTTFGEPAGARAVAERLDEALEVVAGLWSGEPFAHDGRDFHVERVRFLPTPVQRPRPPVWVACILPARRPLARAARWDGVVPLKTGPEGVGFVTPDDIASIVAEIASLRGSLDGFDVVVNAGPPPTASLEAFAAAGATWSMTSMGDFPGWLDVLRGIVDGGPPR